jgi:hypothetical protein
MTDGIVDAWMQHPTPAFVKPRDVRASAAIDGHSTTWPTT